MSYIPLLCPCKDPSGTRVGFIGITMALSSFTLSSISCHTPLVVHINTVMSAYTDQLTLVAKIKSKREDGTRPKHIQNCRSGLTDGKKKKKSFLQLCAMYAWQLWSQELVLLRGLLPGWVSRLSQGDGGAGAGQLQPFHLVSVQIHRTADTGNRYPRTQTKTYTDL